MSAVMDASVLDLVDLCGRCTPRKVAHLGTVCPVSGIEHSSRGAARDKAAGCVCGRQTWNWSARCDECKRGD